MKRSLSILFFLILATCLFSQTINYKIDKVNYEEEALSMVSEYYASLENAFEQEVVS